MQECSVADPVSLFRWEGKAECDQGEGVESSWNRGATIEYVRGTPRAALGLIV